MRRFHRAFTLVELLVVITIIALLAALIVPAVNSAMGTARTNTCRNNLSQIGKATVNYATTKGYFPGYINPKLNASASVFPSWQIALLNNLDRGNTYRSWVDNATGEAPYMEIFICTSDNTAVGLNGQPMTSFAVNTGKLGNTEPTLVYDGVCHNLTTSTAKARRVSLDGIIDGADVTVLASENLDANKYYDTAMGTDPEDLLGIQWSTSTTIPLPINKNGGKRTTFTGADAPYGRPSANHAGVFNVVFAGSNVKTIDENVNAAVWSQLMTPNGKQAGTLTPLQEGSY